MKRLFATILALALVFALLPATASAAPSTLTVGGVVLDGTDGKTYWKNGDTASASGSAADYNACYDATTGTLTLKNADITGAIRTLGLSDYSNCGIYFTLGELTIQLVGTNTVTAGAPTRDSGKSVAIFGDGAGAYLTIVGSGSLVAQSTSPGYESVGVLAQRVTVEGTTVTAIGNTATGNAPSLNSCGVYAGLGITIKDSTVTATGGAAEKATSCGLRTTTGYGSTGFTINNSTVTASTTSTTGTKRALHIKPTLAGVQAQGSTASDGSNPVPYVAADNNTYMWVKTVPAVPVGFSSLTANGSAAETTTELTLTFDKDVTGLTEDDITLTGATKGALTKVTGTTGQYKLTISNITVASGENVTVAVAKTGYAFSPASRTVVVYVYAPPTALLISITPNAVFPQGNSGGDRTVIVGHGTNLAPNEIGEVSMDGTALMEGAQYTKASGGSVNITLPAAYLNTLLPGTHTLSIAIIGGTYAGQNPTIQIIVTAPGGGGGGGGAPGTDDAVVADIPKTGDGATPILWLGLLVSAAAGLLATRRKRRA